MEPPVSENVKKDNEKKFEVITDPDHPPGWLSMKEGELLRLHAQRASTPRVLEIGTLYGRSASFILEGLEEAFQTRQYELWCVDPWHHAQSAVTREFGRPPVVFWQYMCEHEYNKHTRMLQLPVSQAAPLILGNKYEFAFIDGRHREPFVMHDIILCSQVTNTIFLHDYNNENYNFHVKQSVDYWVKNTSWEIKEVVHTTVKIYGPLFMSSALPLEE